MPRGGRRTGGRRSAPSTPRTLRTSNPNTPTSGRGSDGLFSNGQWFCDCKPRLPAVLRETRKPGANKGRFFYTCPQDRRKQCTFFLWEDYAGVTGGGGASSNGGPSSTQAPRPTYRTTMGQRTTPPAERLDGAPPPHMAIVGQQALPPPPPETSRQRQRIFMTPMASEFPQDARYGDQDEEDEDDGFEPPPTPTPARTRRTSSRAATGASLDQTPAQPAPPPTVQKPSHPITKYFGVVKKSGKGESGNSSSSGDGKKGEAAGKAQPPTVPGRNASDYSDSEFDSDMERALVALADHSERKTQRRSDATGRETRAKAKQEESVDDGGSMAMDIEDSGDRRRRIIVPVREEEQPEPETPTRRRIGRRLLVASPEYAAKEVAAATAASTSANTTPTAAQTAGTSGTSSFDSLFGRGFIRGDQMGEMQYPVPNVSFASSVPSSQAPSQAASSQALTQDTVDTDAMTTPSSSFRSDIGTSSGSSRKRRQVVDPWYGTTTTQNGGDEDDTSDDNDPFTTPSKRVRFRDIPDSTESQSTERQEAATASSPTPTPARPTAVKQEPEEPAGITARRHWAEDDGMHVDRDDGQSASQGSSVQILSQEPPKDHNVTLAVLQLLAGQPIAPRVRQQVRALLNGAFADEEGR